MTTVPSDLASQTLALLETLIDDMARRAIERHTPQKSTEKLWVSAKEASVILGEGYPVERVKELGRKGRVVMDRRDPTNPANSPYIFLRSSLHEYSARRVFEIDQAS